MKYVIIGNSAAAVGAVEGIRKLDQKGEITIISSEPYHTYSRPLISYLLLGRVKEEEMNYRGSDFYTANNCRFLPATTVTAIDHMAKRVVLDKGGSVVYDKLLVATGSSPFVPQLSGLERVKDKYTFMSLNDAHRLDKALDTPKRVLIIGAGLIGLKCAEGIAKRCSQLTVVDLAPRILSSILDKDSSKMVQQHLERNGVSLRLSASVQSFSERSATLENGEVIDFDLLVLAVGVRPNTALLKDIATVEKGIAVDSGCRTSAEDIYAAGDCTQCMDISSGESRVMALLPNAYMQGECAGTNMAGGECSFDNAIPMNAIGFFGLHIITAGSYSGSLYSEAGSNSCKRLFYKDNLLKGYILVGEVAKAGVYTSLIRERTPLDTIDFRLICEKPGLMAFAKAARQEKLGGGAR